MVTKRSNQFVNDLKKELGISSWIQTTLTPKPRNPELPSKEEFPQKVFDLPV